MKSILHGGLFGANGPAQRGTKHNGANRARSAACGATRSAKNDSHAAALVPQEPGVRGAIVVGGCACVSACGGEPRGASNEHHACA